MLEERRRELETKTKRRQLLTFRFSLSELYGKRRLLHTKKEIQQLEVGTPIITFAVEDQFQL